MGILGWFRHRFFPTDVEQYIALRDKIRRAPFPPTPQERARLKELWTKAWRDEMQLPQGESLWYPPLPEMDAQGGDSDNP